MTDAEGKAILTISLLAAFADGNKSDLERGQIKRIAEGLTADSSIDVARLYQDVLLKRVSVENAAAALGSHEARQLAYEMAVCVCDADGATSAAEQAFLDRLRGVLRLGGEATRIDEDAQAIATTPLASPDATPQLASSLTPAELDKMILNAAILNGALELLPESLSTMAIIPLQMKLVYKVGKAHGFELDRGHIKDFLGTLGVGLTAQYLEEAGRKLLGGLLGKLGGGMLGGLGKQAVSSGMAFASTYALGHVAKRYYAGGRTISVDMLKQSFNEMLGEARGMQARYLPDMQQKARGLDARSVMDLVRRA